MQRQSQRPLRVGVPGLLINLIGLAILTVVFLIKLVFVVLVPLTALAVIIVARGVSALIHRQPLPRGFLASSIGLALMVSTNVGLNKASRKGLRMTRVR